MNQNQPCFTDFPGLLYELLEPSTLDNLGRVEPVEVNFHEFSPDPLLAKHRPSLTDEQ
jgi:hypothetical protein